jgi:hypothetical protein
VPGTAGNRRTVLDVVLYGGVLLSLFFLLLSDGDAGLLDRNAIAVTLVLLCLLGLRDKVSFLAARPEVYGLMLVVCLFAAETQIVGWQLFMIFGLLFLFGHYGDVPLSTLDPVLLAIILVVGVLIPILGNLFPDKISFLPAMRYYAGNWATSKWMFRKSTDAEGKFDRDLYKVAPINVKQLEGMYDAETASYMIDGGLAFRALHSHGRALTGLLNRAAPGDVDDYHVREGELVSGLANGWNFGDGHFHHKQLLDAVQEQVRFAEGDVRVIALESQPAHVQRQRYRIYDAATGLLEEGWVNVSDMRARGPWLEGDWDFPVEVTGRTKA